MNIHKENLITSNKTKYNPNYFYTSIWYRIT